MYLSFLILHRYILNRHIGPFLFSLFVITLLFLLNLAFRVLGRILSKGLDFWVIVEFFGLNLAWIIALTVPMAVLTASLMAFGSLAADNEITALKASGVSLYRIIGFNLIVSVLIALFLVWFNNAILPDFNHRARILGSDINAKRPTLKLDPGVLFQQDKFNIIVTKILSEKDNVSQVAGITIFFKKDQQFNNTIVAERGEIFVDEANEKLRINLFNGTQHEVDWQNMEKYQKLNFDRHVITIDVPGLALTRRDDSYFSDREMSAQRMLEQVHLNQAEIKKQLQEINDLVIPKVARHLQQTNSDSFYLPERIAFNSRLILNDNGNKPPSKMNPDAKERLTLGYNRLIAEYRQLMYQLRTKNNVIDNFHRRNYVLLVEIHKKYSIPVACIIFVLVGAPLGIIARRGNMAASGGIGLFFFILYWAFLIAGEELADRQVISPAVAMWSPNVVVGIFGIYLVFSVVKETKFISFKFTGWKKFMSRWRFTSLKVNHENS